MSFPLIIKSKTPANQFIGRSFNPTKLIARVIPPANWSTVQPNFSSPENIIELFKRSAFLEALAMVVSWGTMWRNPDAIYGHRHLCVIKKTLHDCSDSIHSTQSITDSWKLLTAPNPFGLGWSAVLTSKTLHFLSRSIGFNDDPPVPIDNRIIRQNVWPVFKNGIPPNLEIPEGWSGNGFDAYTRYMTAILTWANQRNWTTTEIESTIFSEY